MSTTSETIRGRGIVCDRPETEDMLLKTTALYLLSDWLGCSAAEAMGALTRSHYVPGAQAVLDNINERGRHGLRINVRRL